MDEMLGTLTLASQVSLKWMESSEEIQGFSGDPGTFGLP
jgi:hypothetical protein